SILVLVLLLSYSVTLLFFCFFLLRPLPPRFTLFPYTTLFRSMKLIPAARIGHIGMYRDEESLEPVEYFVKLPEDIDQREVLVVDQMLATCGSTVMAIDS